MNSRLITLWKCGLMLLIILFAAQPFSSASQSTIRFTLDSGNSQFIVKTSSGGLFGAFGHNHVIKVGNFSGVVEITPGKLEPASMEMAVKADSLVVTDKISEKDIKEIESTMREQVLETGRYPEIGFKS